MGTFDKTARRLWPLQDWLGSRGIKDLELLTDDLVREYLEDRLAYVHDFRNALHKAMGWIAPGTEIEYVELPDITYTLPEPKPEDRRSYGYGYGYR